MYCQNGGPQFGPSSGSAQGQVPSSNPQPSPGLGNRVLNPAIPYHGLIPKLMDGLTIVIQGKVLPNAKQFVTQLLCSGGDVACRISPSLVGTAAAGGGEVLVCNSRARGQWGTEQRTPMDVSLTKVEHFECLILVTQQSYRVAFCGKHVAEYRHSIPMDRVDSILIEGEVRIQSIFYKRPAGPVPASREQGASGVRNLGAGNDPLNFGGGANVQPNPGPALPYPGGPASVPGAQPYPPPQPTNNPFPGMPSSTSFPGGSTQPFSGAPTQPFTDPLFPGQTFPGTSLPSTQPPGVPPYPSSQAGVPPYGTPSYPDSNAPSFDKQPYGTGYPNASNDFGMSFTSIPSAPPEPNSGYPPTTNPSMYPPSTGGYPNPGPGYPSLPGYPNPSTVYPSLSSSSFPFTPSYPNPASSMCPGGSGYPSYPNPQGSFPSIPSDSLASPAHGSLGFDGLAGPAAPPGSYPPGYAAGPCPPGAIGGAYPPGPNSLGSVGGLYPPASASGFYPPGSGF